MRISIELESNSLNFKTENLGTEMYREKKKKHHLNVLLSRCGIMEFLN